MTLQALLLVHLASTWFMAGVIWFVQVVHYPLMSAVSPETFSDYHRRHVNLTGWVVGPAMLVEATSALLLLFHLDGVALVWAWRGFSLVILIWLVTALLSVPAHHKLGAGFDQAVHRRLVRTNWVRTVAWTLRSALTVAIVLETGLGAGLG